jgi:ubiquitin carboxyl-terminal hydrolase 4/11/15
MLSFLLETLHEDVNDITKKPYIEYKNSDDRPDIEVS